MKSTVFIGFLSTLVVCAESLDFSLSTETRPNVVPNKFIIEVEHTASLDRRGDVIHVCLSIFDRVAMPNYSVATRRSIPPDQVS